MGLRILDVSDLDTVRAISMSMVDSERAKQLMPNSTLQAMSFAGRAELLVIRRVGPDWILIVAGNAPQMYAGGDKIIAQDLLRDAAIMYTCSLVCSSLRQIIPRQEESELIRTTRDLSWDKIQKEYQDQAVVSLNLLRPQRTSSALVMSRPFPAPSDPDKYLNFRTFRPVYARLMPESL